MGLNRPDRSDMEYISSAEQRTITGERTRSLRSQLSDLRTSYCQRFISSPPNWHFICIPASVKIEHLGKTMTGSLAVVTSYSSTGLMPLTGLLPITDPPPSLSPHHQTTRVYLAWIEKEHLMSVTLICQLAGPILCRHTATWKTERCLWRIERDRWVRRERPSNAIMFFRYEYKMTQLTGHTRFYFISQCTRPPYFVFFVLFSSDYLHLISTAGRHLEHFRFKARVSILDLSLKCKTPAIDNIAWVSTYHLTHTHILHTHAQVA